MAPLRTYGDWEKKVVSVREAGMSMCTPYMDCCCCFSGLYADEVIKFRGIPGAAMRSAIRDAAHSTPVTAERNYLPIAMPLACSMNQSQTIR